MTKLSKDEVLYGRGMVHSHCGKILRDDKGYCTHFKATFRGNPWKEGSCEVVAGKISPVMWCNQWKRA